MTELDSRLARQGATITAQQKQMDVLVAQLKEQAAQIQKVSAEVELNKTVSRTVSNK